MVCMCIYGRDVSCLIYILHRKRIFSTLSFSLFFPRIYTISNFFLYTRSLNFEKQAEKCSEHMYRRGVLTNIVNIVIAFGDICNHAFYGVYRGVLKIASKSKITVFEFQST